MNNFDIYIKHEGDFATVIFQSDNAKKIAEIEGLKQKQYPYYKIDLDLIELHKILIFGATHGLSVDSEVQIIIPSKN